MGVTPEYPRMLHKPNNLKLIVDDADQQAQAERLGWQLHAVLPGVSAADAKDEADRKQADLDAAAKRDAAIADAQGKANQDLLKAEEAATAAAEKKAQADADAAAKKAEAQYKADEVARVKALAEAEAKIRVDAQIEATKPGINPVVLKGSEVLPKTPAKQAAKK